VLIVDDNSTNRRVLEEMVRLWGAEPTTASSAAEGLSELDRAISGGAPHGVLLVDMHMPGADGLAFVEQVRARSGEARVVMLTSERRPGDVDRGRALGRPSRPPPRRGRAAPRRTPRSRCGCSLRRTTP
jgi:CheY-like chemotaxis protein